MQFKKNLLAISISSAAAVIPTVGQAQTTISSTISGSVILDGSTAPDLTITSSGTIDFTGLGAGVYNASPITLTGSVTNDGLIVGDNIGVIINGGTVTTSNTGLAVLTGSITNNGTIDTQAGNSGAVLVRNGTVQSGIVNSVNGIISGTGLGVAVAESSVLLGGVSNDGQIDVTFNSAGAVGVGVFDNSSLSGGITNTGVITSEGNGIFVGISSTASGGINNSGSIQGGTGSFGNGIGIYTDNDATINGDIVNTGLIEGSAGMEFAAATINGDIINSGTIRGNTEDYAAIDIYSEVFFDGTSNVLISSSMAGSIINLTGGIIENTTTAFPDDDPAPALWFSGVDVQGNGVDAAITNQSGAIIRSAQAEAIVIDSEKTLDGIAMPDTVINGIDNAGIIESTNGMESAISIYGGKITGGINNSGTISGAQALRINGITNDIVEDTPSGGETETISQNTTAGVTGGITNTGTLSGSITAAQVSSGSLPLFSTNAFDYGTISITHGASVDFITNSGLIENTGVAPGITIGSNNDLTEICNIECGDPLDVLLGLPLATVEPGTVTGNITNSGDIIAADSTAIFLNNGAVNGSIINNAGATIDGSNGGIIAFNSSITGGITNAGDITSLGPNGPAMNNAYGVDIQQSTVGAINNSGTITGGLILEDVTSTGDITNTGSVVAAAAGGDGVVIRGTSSVATLSSSGTIAGDGGVVVEQGAALATLDNQGSITGSSVGVAVVDAGSSIGALINGANGVIDGAIEGAIITRDGGSIGSVTNAGTIMGQTDFGAAGGSFDNSGTAGDLLAVTAVTNSGTLGNVQFVPGGGTFVSTAGTVGNVTGVSGASSNAGTVGNVSFAAAGVFTNTGSAGDISGADDVINSGSTGNVTGVNGVINTGMIMGQVALTGGDVLNDGDISGGISGALNVFNTGTIGGNVMLNGGSYASDGGTSGTVTGAGVMVAGSLGNGVTVSTINGDLTFNGELVVVAAAQSGAGFTSNGRFEVTGDVDLTGATINVALDTGSVTAEGDEFAFLGAGGSLISDASTADGLDIDSGSSVVGFTIEERGNELFAIAGVSDFTAPIDDVIEEAGLTGSTGADNVTNVAEALNDVPAEDVESGSELDQVLGNLQSSSLTDEEKVVALTTLDPDTVESSAVGALSADTAAAGTVNNRVAALRGYYGFSGAVAGDPMGIHGFWVQAYDNETDQSTRDGVDGFDADTFGFAGGFDGAISENVNAGVAFSYADTDVEGKVEANEMSIESYRLALYGSYNAETYYLDSQLAYAFNEYETERAIDPTLTSAPLVATGDHDGDQYSLRVRGGYPIATESGWYITPKSELDYTYLAEDGYTEKGAGNAGLKVDSQSVEVLILGLGVKFAYPITTASETTWIPELSLDYLYDFIGDEVEIDSNFIGVSGGGFITSGADVEQEMYKASLRLRVFGQGSLSFSGGIDYIEKDEYDSQSIMATMRYDF
ncbi:autotransporter domain-containing protein [Oceanicoccus sagamiensis]|uniref:Autotransporter domain-containing protein n=1 Tax=Oceanicoccus sagamiensis TaxID=716816 RepID=A0A1X9NEB5_9GAMM|nr:autotransporter domain-containing protein [Oceanicoccus sagamiensis]ARN74235.1 hypothetical protein BST96_08940 [Oceanicoccus sagamiensis]